MKKFFTGFSIIELLISLVTISCIVAAFAPAITKKLNKIDTALALSSSGITTECKDKFSEYCSLCYKNKCIICSLDCNENQYTNIETCLCEECSERGEGCIKCAKTKCSVCNKGYYLNNEECVPCPVGHKCETEGILTPTPCPAGTYQDEEKQIACKYCTAGKWNEEVKEGERITDCDEDCPAGYACKDGIKSQCPAGSYTPKGSGSCT